LWQQNGGTVSANAIEFTPYGSGYALSAAR
jgi:hypothetical protein